jgi:hypothetical protein
MSDPDFIVSMAGNLELQARAGHYNARRNRLSKLKMDLSRADEWNTRERFGSGWFSSTKPPISTSAISEEIEHLRDILTKERDEIVRLSDKSVRP